MLKFLQFSPDGKILLSSSGLRPFTLWDIAKFKELVTIESTEQPAFCAAFSPDSSMVVWGGRAGTLKLWDV
jgi:WD40 repeat protein